MSTQLVWYTARSAGMVAWAVSAASVIWGLALSTRALGRRPRPAWLFDLHRFLGGLALIFTAVHVGAILADSYVHFGLVEVLVPFVGTWHPVAVAWGIIGLYLLLAVELTSLVRTHIPTRIWRRVHFGSFALYGVSTIHALSAGTDGRSIAFLFVVVASLVAVVAMSAMRIAGSRHRAHLPMVPPRADGPVNVTAPVANRSVRVLYI